MAPNRALLGHGRDHLPAALDGPCTALVEEIAYAEDDGDEEGLRHERLTCETPRGLTYEIPAHTIPPGWMTEMIHRGELVSGATRLDFSPGLLSGAGEPVRIDGPTQALDVLEMPALVNDNGPNRRNLKAVVTGERTILAVRVVAPGK